MPTIANGKVYVGTTTGVGVLGLLTGNLTSSIGITKTHTGNFTQGQSGAIYSITVNNGTAAATTSGAVTVTEAPPAGLTITAMSGSGWTCSGNTCTRTDPLSPGASYPAITVTANVAASAPSTVTNQVRVSGGGSTATASDATTIAPASSATVSLTAVQNAASYASGQIAPGEIVFLSGSGMGPSQLIQYQVNSSGYITT